MRLQALHIQRLAGIQPGFFLDDLHPGINVITGPNASGKSSLVRALRAVLYAEELRRDPIHVTAEFEDRDGGLVAERLGPNLQWRRNGAQSEPPPLPDHQFLGCYTLRLEDLLDHEHATDAEIGARLARELAGGYDLPAIREQPPFALKQNHGRAEARALSEAERELRRRQQAQQRLQQDEARLADLQARKERAKQAATEVEFYDRALELLEVRRALRSLEERQREFPAGIEGLRDDDGETLARLLDQQHRLDTEREQAAKRRAAADRALAGSGLADSALDEATLADHHQSVQRLRDLEHRLRQQNAEHAKAETRLEQALQGLGGAPGEHADITPDTLHRVEEFLGRKRELDAHIAQLEAERTRLPERGQGEPEPERLRTARQELLRWLAAPADPGWTTANLAAAGAVLGAGVLGIGMAAFLFHWALLLLLAPLGWGVYRLLRPGAGAPQRRHAESRFAETGVAPPAAWRPEPVRERLDTLDQELREATQRILQLERRETLERELATQHKALEEVRGNLRATCTRAGYDPERLDASLERWIRLVHEHDQARLAAAQRRRERDDLAAEAAGLREEAVAFLTAYGEAPLSAAPDAETLSSRLEGLAGRLRQRDEALRNRTDAEDAIRRREGDLAQTHADLEALYRRAGLAPDDEDGLRERLRRLSEWRDFESQVRDTRALDREHDQRLGDRDDLRARVAEDDETGLRQRRAALQEEVDELEGLIQEITRIQHEIAQAGEHRALEAARLHRQQCEDALRERLDEALFAGAGRFLLAQVAAEHEQAVQPAALARAREWFRRFTRHQFELLFEPNGEHRFAARETATGERRRLTELSSGTRMQLLLAVRIAFALEAERGCAPLPLILDEALTAADPERFQAAAEALGVFAEETGRQVFYLTAQPEEARYWASQDKGVHCIDLAAVRGQAQAIADPAALTAPAPSDVPRPAGESPEAYAVALGVPPIAPWDGAEAIHLFHLLRDDLGLLHRLLTLGVERTGQLTSLLDSAATEDLLDHDERRQLRTRLAGARAWLAAWRQGRGRPLDRHALEASGAVTATFLDRVASLNDQVGGDGEQLIERLAEGAVSRFQRDRREQLEAWLTEQGYIDRREPATETERRARITAAMQPHLADRDEAPEAAHWLLWTLETGLAGTATGN